MTITEDWPFCANYEGKCFTCSGKFFGPKRAPHCWGCMGPDNREEQIKGYRYVQELMRNRRAVDGKERA